ncbi:MAG TPA: alkaline phosphatase family protein [Acidimicrobiales bacterium]|nr:alkaline phosphatase family protein [Acidimicrobiales bacterium]
MTSDQPASRRFAVITSALLAASGLVFGACGSRTEPATATSAVEAASAPSAIREHPGRGAGRLQHLFVIMMENHGTDEIIGNTADAPYINSLAQSHAVATSYYGVTHPSLPNYLALFSGDFQGIWDDCKAGPDVTCAPEEFVPNSGDATSTLLLTPAEVASASATPHWFAGQNLVDQVEQSGRTWKAYMQSLPSVGSNVEYAPVIDGSPVKLYAQKHNPFMYFSDIRDSHQRMKRIVPATQLDRDLATGDVPDLVWLSPDQCHDMHGMSPAMAAAVGLPDCGYPDSGLDHGAIALGDAYLKDTVGKIMASPAWDDGAAIAIVWDEDDYAGYAGCCGSPVGTQGGVLGGAQAPALVVTSWAQKPQIATQPFNHYSLLATIEHLWGLDCLGHACAIDDDAMMTSLFGLADADAPVGGLVDHALLLSVDGLHATDLDGWVHRHPTSALARLARRGATYTAAKTTTPSDSFPGLLALVTGGSPRSTGVYYDDSYDRTLYPPGSGCQGSPGSEIVYDETVDRDLTKLFSGGINPDNLPLALDGTGCHPVFPHSFLKANTLFEVVKEHGGRTAWSDKHPSYDLVNGPSGTGVDDLYTPEINSNIQNGGVVNGVDLAGTLAACDGTNSLPVSKVQVYTDCLPAVLAYDDVKVQAILNQIAGKRSDGSAGAGVPTVFGMNFQAVSVGQKLPVGGYTDAAGTPSAVLDAAIAHTDASIGKMVAALEARHLLGRTLVVVTAKHGQSPIDPTRLAMEGGKHAPVETVQDPLGFIDAADPSVDGTTFTNTLPGSSGGTYATGGHLQTDDVGIVWLQDQSPANVAGVVASLTSPATTAAIFATVLPPRTVFTTNITSGAQLASLFGDPTSSDATAAARAPNVFIQPDEGVIYSGSSKKIAEHGGGAPGDTEVALLVAGPWTRGHAVHEPVHTTQVAPTILRALGLDPRELVAGKMEGTRPLPDLAD